MTGEDSESRYTLGEPLGSGGMVEGVKARNGQLRRWAALKFLHVPHPLLARDLAADRERAVALAEGGKVD